jgi:hypothetical protein
MSEQTKTDIDEEHGRVPDRGPLGDARPNADAPDPRTGGGQSQEDVDDRPNVSTVKPEDYPDKASGKDVI